MTPELITALTNILNSGSFALGSLGIWIAIKALKEVIG